MCKIHQKIFATLAPEQKQEKIGQKIILFFVFSVEDQFDKYFLHKINYLVLS